MITPSKTGQLRDLAGRQKSLLRLVELSVTLNSTLNLDELLQQITATATELLECEAASILLYDEQNPRLYFAAATGSDPAQLAEVPVPIDSSLAGTIFRTNQPIILNNAGQDPRHYSLVSEHIKFKVNSMLGVPMPIKDRTMGVLEGVNKREGGFTDGDVAILSVIAAHAAIAINNARMLKATQQALEKVKVTNQIKSNFLALASHELRTPLSVIMGYASFLQEGASAETTGHVNHVMGAALQMRSILDQMNNLTLLQADEMEMRQMKISIQSVLNFALDEIKYSAARRDMRLVLDFQDDPIYVNVDPEKTALAFVNLLNNAIRFSAEETEITVGAARQEKQVLVWVQDHGIGIPIDKLQKVFEEFYQIEPPHTRRHGGLG
ncbi:GAF domain-containing sensor histidine kinase, partial [bacterium]|nr:GAF domain-containing sensor histidine kinase [bacterium]